MALVIRKVGFIWLWTSRTGNLWWRFDQPGSAAHFTAISCCSRPCMYGDTFVRLSTMPTLTPFLGLQPYSRGVPFSVGPRRSTTATPRRDQPLQLYLPLQLRRGRARALLSGAFHHGSSHLLISCIYRRNLQMRPGFTHIVRSPPQAHSHDSFQPRPRAISHPAPPRTLTTCRHDLSIGPVAKLLPWPGFNDPLTHSALEGPRIGYQRLQSSLPLTRRIAHNITRYRRSDYEFLSPTVA
jgi:hypothetical protein